MSGTGLIRIRFEVVMPLSVWHSLDLGVQMNRELKVTAKREKRTQPCWL